MMVEQSRRETSSLTLPICLSFNKDTMLSGITAFVVPIGLDWELV